MIGARVAISPTFVDEEEHAAGETVVVGNDDAALTGRDVLPLLEAECSERTERPDLSAIVARHERLRAILDDRNAVRVRELLDRFHVGWIAEQMGNDDSPRSGRDRPLDRFGGDVVRMRVDVGEDRNRTLIENRRERPHVGNRRGDDFVSGLRIDGGDGAVNGGGSGGTRNGVLYSQHLCESPFEFLDVFALRTGQRAAANSFGNQQNLFRAEVPAAGVLVARQPPKSHGVLNDVTPL